MVQKRITQEPTRNARAILAETGKTLSNIEKTNAKLFEK